MFGWSFESAMPRWTLPRATPRPERVGRSLALPVADRAVTGIQLVDLLGEDADLPAVGVEDDVVAF
jgi:hypothetical protein